MQPTHILHVITGLGLGGAERMMVQLANATVAAGHRVSVCVTRGVTTIEGDLDPRIARFVLGRTRRFEARAFARITQFVRRERVDLIHAHERAALKFLLPLAVTRVVRVPIVFHDHYGTIETDARIPLWFRIGHRFVSQYVGVYDRLTSWARAAGMAEARMSTIFNAIDLSRIESAPPHDLRRELGVSSDRVLGLMTATIRRDKGIEVMLEAVARSRHRNRMHIAVAGVRSEPGYVEMCEQLKTRLGLAQEVTFLGGRTDVPSLLRGVDFGLMASHSEAGPLALIEYIVAALPVVSTIVGDIGRRLADAGLPGFVPPGSIDRLATALDELVGLEPALRRERGERGRQLIAGGWDLRDVMSSWYDVYQAALTNAH